MAPSGATVARALESLRKEFIAWEFWSTASKASSSVKPCRYDLLRESQAGIPRSCYNARLANFSLGDEALEDYLSSGFGFTAPNPQNFLKLAIAQNAFLEYAEPPEKCHNLWLSKIFMLVLPCFPRMTRSARRRIGFWPQAVQGAWRGSVSWRKSVGATGCTLWRSARAASTLTCTARTPMTGAAIV